MQLQARALILPPAGPPAGVAASWQPRCGAIDSDDNDDVEGESGDEGDEHGFVLPPGWETVRKCSNGSMWTDGRRTVGTISKAWELHTADSEGRAGGTGGTGRMGGSVDDDDGSFNPDEGVSVEALLDSLLLTDDEVGAAWSDARPDEAAARDHSQLDDDEAELARLHELLASTASFDWLEEDLSAILHDKGLQDQLLEILEDPDKEQLPRIEEITSEGPTEKVGAPPRTVASTASCTSTAAAPSPHALDHMEADEDLGSLDE